MSWLESAIFSINDVAFAVILLVLFSLFSYTKKSLTKSGIVFGNIVGLAVFFIGGLTNFLVIVAFFLTAEFSTFYSRKRINKKHEQRTTSNIIGNSGAAILTLILGQSIGFFGAVAAALSDTVSSEIGMLSKKKPKLITNFKEVKIGTDGAITPGGLAAGIIGSLFIAAIHFYLNLNYAFFAIILVSGFIGSLTDSYLGAIFERKGILNNTQVNFLASLSGAVTAVLLGTMF